MTTLVQLLQRRPGLVVLLGASGLSLLLPSGFALLAPLPLLDAAASLGDARLALIILALFVGSSAAGWLFVRQWHADNPARWSAAAAKTAAQPARSYLR